jgi:putative flippase GtrA
LPDPYEPDAPLAPPIKPEAQPAPPIKPEAPPAPPIKPEAPPAPAGFTDVGGLAEHLRSPRSGLTGQLVRFALTGGLVTVLYLTVTTVLSQLVGLPFQVALAIGFVSALLLHFTLQRLFVWIHEDGFALPLRHQVGRYLLMAGAQYGGTAAATAVLPGALGVPTELVYLATMAVATTAGFLIMRFVIFHGTAATPDEQLAGPASQPSQRGGKTPTVRTL